MITSRVQPMDGAERNAGMLRVPLVVSLVELHADGSALAATPLVCQRAE
jgi:hypothetical protein